MKLLLRSLTSKVSHCTQVLGRLLGFYFKIFENKKENDDLNFNSLILTFFVKHFSSVARFILSEISYIYLTYIIH